MLLYENNHRQTWNDFAENKSQEAQNDSYQSTKSILTSEESQNRRMFCQIK